MKRGHKFTSSSSFSFPCSSTNDNPHRFTYYSSTNHVPSSTSLISSSTKRILTILLLLSILSSLSNHNNNGAQAQAVGEEPELEDIGSGGGRGRGNVGGLQSDDEDLVSIENGSGDGFVDPKRPLNWPPSEEADIHIMAGGMVHGGEANGDSNVHQQHRHALSTSVIIAIIVACSLVLIILVVVITICCVRRKREQELGKLPSRI